MPIDRIHKLLVGGVLVQFPRYQRTPHFVRTRVMTHTVFSLSYCTPSNVTEIATDLVRRELLNHRRLFPFASLLSLTAVNAALGDTVFPPTTVEHV